MVKRVWRCRVFKQKKKLVTLIVCIGNRNGSNSRQMDFLTDPVFESILSKSLYLAYNIIKQRNKHCVLRCLNLSNRLTITWVVDQSNHLGLEIERNQVTHGPSSTLIFPILLKRQDDLVIQD